MEALDDKGDLDIVPRIPNLKDTINYIATNCFKDQPFSKRQEIIENWISDSPARMDVLEKAVELCLLKRDESERAITQQAKLLKTSEEREFQEHIEKLILNDTP